MAELSVDAVITGTGLTAAVAAACLARSGKKVLQIDRCSCYGQALRTVSFKQLLEMREARCLNSHESLLAQYEAVSARREAEVRESGDEVDSAESSVSAHAGEQRCQPVGQPRWSTRKADQSAQRMLELVNLIYNDKDPEPAVVFELAPFERSGTNEIEALDHLCSESNKYALDLWPKLLFARSAAVDLLLSSGADNYIHFTDTRGPMLYGHEPATEGEQLVLHEVPNSRNAISRSTLLSPLEKRGMMQVLTTLVADNFVPQFSSLALSGRGAPPGDGAASKTVVVDDPERNWLEFLRAHGCTQNTVDLLSHGLCLGGRDVPTWTKQHAVQRLMKYVTSIGVYGQWEAPFLCPMYGTGDVVQAFSRVGAVLGATFMLGTRIVGVTAEEERVSSVSLSNGTTVRTKMVLVDDEVTAGEAVCRAVARAPGGSGSGHGGESGVRLHVVSLVIPEPIIPDLNLAVILPKQLEGAQEVEGVEPIYMVQTSAEAGAAPENKYIVYFMVVDASEPARFSSFAGCDHPTVARMLRCYGALAAQKGVSWEQTVMAMYTSHELGGGDAKWQEDLERHRGWLAEGAEGPRGGGNGVVAIPKVKGTPVVPMLEEIPAALALCDALLGRADRRLEPYNDGGLTECLDVTRELEPEENGSNSAVNKLQSIIDKYG
ncbi:rab proteins geranylgeranyltransferase component A 1 [Babesia caballi]|uniref:Rab proteins geranylgeranyltransferase component A 1 n=1 Tax=Babesia caballi TaxID=5871 RepID=A0AAV4LT71_BABCB|nr:rab proteins geranylgeranyltransferase component A 1 [Babesia caballi]